MLKNRTTRSTIRSSVRSDGTKICSHELSGGYYCYAGIY